MKLTTLLNEALTPLTTKVIQKASAGFRSILPTAFSSVYNEFTFENVKYKPSMPDNSYSFKWSGVCANKPSDFDYSVSVFEVKDGASEQYSGMYEVVVYWKKKVIDIDLRKATESVKKELKTIGKIVDEKTASYATRFFLEPK